MTSPDHFKLPSREECARRLRTLAAILHALPNGKVALIPGVNVDRSVLPKEIDGVPMPVPSIEHVMKVCAVCGDDIWLGPRQAKHAGIRLCYICISIYQAVHGEVKPQALNPGIDDVPRRRI